MVDPRFYLYTESTEWLKLRNGFRSPEQKRSLDATSRHNFETFLAESRGKEEAFLFTTGPSLDAAGRLEYSERSLKIVCNSMVKNDKLLDHIRPDVLAFADDVFHFGPSLYAAKFRDDFLRTMERFPKCYAFIPAYAHDLMLAHYPHLSGRLIGVPFASAGAWVVPSLDRFAVQSTGNILTFLMIPIAGAVCKKMFVLGADGRRPDETYFWKHSEKNQFGDLMWSVFECHPSFFEDNDYHAYYLAHCDQVESQITWLEASGHRVLSLTASHIPALRKRQANELLTPQSPVEN